MPQIFLDYFHKHQTIYSHHTRQKNVHFYSVHSTFGQRFFKFQCVKKFQELLKLHLLSLTFLLKSMLVHVAIADVV